jgi:hypothetical protein
VPYNIAEFSTQVSIHFTTCYFLLFLHSYTQANYVVVKFSSLFGSEFFFSIDRLLKAVMVLSLLKRPNLDTLVVI